MAQDNMRRGVSEWRENVEAIKTFGLAKVLYWRFVYRHHMRLIHKRGRHAMKHYGPLLPGGGEFDKCDWCGHIENVVPQRTPLFDHLTRAAASKAKTPPP